MRRCLFLLLAVLAAQSAFGQKPEFVYDAGFEFYFDNREMDAGKEAFTRSMTINTAFLTPSVGLRIKQNARNVHQVMAGLDIIKSMGEYPVRTPAAAGSDDADRGLENTRLLREITLWYRFDLAFSKAKLTGVFGAYPRSLSRGNYSQAFWSDSLRHLDRNFDGALLQLQTSKAFFELGCDWKGHQSEFRREEFVIFTYGEWTPKEWLTLGWAGTFHHFAGSYKYPGVVDDNLVEPFAQLNAGKMAGIQLLTLRLGWLQAMQRDRVQQSGTLTPGGAEIYAEARHWNISLVNRFYAGKNLMPLYTNPSVAGTSYGSDLYMGSPFYRIGREAGKSGVYDRVEAWWQPRIASFLDLKLGTVFHFEDGFQGHQEVVSLIFSLDRILNKKPAKKVTTYRFKAAI